MAGEVRQEGHVCSSERLKFDSSTHMAAPTVHNFSSRRSNMFFWPIWAPDTMWYTYTHPVKTLTHIKDNNLFLKYTYKYIECSLIVQSSLFFFPFHL